jgi:hypothetical protein
MCRRSLGAQGEALDVLGRVGAARDAAVLCGLEDGFNAGEGGGPRRVG